MRNYGTSEHQSYKQEAIQAAKELKYNAKYIEKLKQAKTEDEITRIMSSARQAKFENYLF